MILTLNEIMVVGVGLGLIGLIYWFFLGKKDEDGQVVMDVKIKVSGGYSPALVKIPAGKEITMTLTRTDPTDCLEEFTIPDLKIKRTYKFRYKNTITV